MAGVGEALVSAVLKEVLRKLGSAVGDQIKMRRKLKQDLEDIKSTLGMLQAVLRDAERRAVREEGVNLWLKMLKNAAYDISDMLDEFEVKLSEGKVSRSVARFFMGRKLKNMREKLTYIASQRTQFGFMLNSCSMDQEEIKKRETTSKINRTTIVGRKDEKEEVVKLLKSDYEHKTSVIPIFGFGGIGKTTLAKMVFNDEQMQSFDLRVWVYVSPHFDLKTIGKSIISQINGQIEGLDDLQSLSRCLEETLDGKSCLIVLDDLWENNCFQLSELMLMLSNFKKESLIRVIVTTRSEQVATKLGTVIPYKLNPLSDDHCWTLFKHIAFQSGCASGEDDKNVMENIGRDIAKKCQGVPMAAQALGFMLRCKAVEEWKNVRDSDIWNNGSTLDDVLPSLKLSYYQMPPYLKLCFSYCSVFPKGFEIPRHNLIQQWISLGLIPFSPGMQTLEKIGENYVNELLGMSFLQYSRVTSLTTKEDTNNSMLISMHDLMHDLGRSVIGDELLLMDNEKEYDPGNCNYRYALMVNCVRQTAFRNDAPAKLRALHAFDCAEIDVSLFSKSLRVLDLGNCPNGNLAASIGKLKQLRYLSACAMQNKDITKHITSLPKLIHLKLNGSSTISTLPDSIKKLRSLLHLDLSGCCNLWSLPESFGHLTSLSYLNLANCSRLETLPESVSKLRSLLHLDLSWCCALCSLPESFGDLTSLSYLNLANCSLLNALPESVSKLRSLLHLDLSGCCALCSLPKSFGDLTNLSELNMANGSVLKNLPESVDKLRCLSHLDLRRCSCLSSLPESFGELINLLHLDLSHCYDLYSLPKSFGRLTELQYLNLSYCLKLNLLVDIENVLCLTKLQYLNLSRCPSLIYLPESVNNLKRLHTLDLSGCQWIEKFPERLYGMTSLKFLLINGCSAWLQKRVRESQFKNDMLTLPKFIVQRANFCKPSNVSRLKSVYPTELEIECLENVASTEEADVVNLAGKSGLSRLVLAWTPESERFVEDEALLPKFQPPETIVSLKIQGYMAGTFSGWTMDMASCLLHLVRIEMVDLPECEYLPPFGQLRNLEQLVLKRMPILKKLGTEICGGNGAFQKLREFTLENLANLEEWDTKVMENGEFMFPSLHRLEICYCPKLRLKPCLPKASEWRIEASDVIIASQYDAGSSSSLTMSKLQVRSCQLLPSDWRLLQLLPALEVLEISNYKENELPYDIRFLVSLRSLQIDGCNVFKLSKRLLKLSLLCELIISGCQMLWALPKFVRNLTALNRLEISDSGALQTWCRKRDSWIWRNDIKKKIYFDGKLMIKKHSQEDDCTVNTEYEDTWSRAKDGQGHDYPCSEYTDEQSQDDTWSENTDENTWSEYTDENNEAFDDFMNV